MSGAPKPQGDEKEGVWFAVFLGVFVFIIWLWYHLNDPATEQFWYGVMFRKHVVSFWAYIAAVFINLFFLFRLMRTWILETKAGTKRDYHEEHLLKNKK